ncbi:MAG: hypothetical protein Q7K28_03420 [Candidatus Wildermuthbacteria bacterium]|nr:hypothetical protein [Candidatus Wildermuthbacteria bacterium]
MFRKNLKTIFAFRTFRTIRTNRTFNSGFTLIEVLTAIFFVTVGAGGVFTLASQANVSSQINSQKLVASYLAQEGVELVRNIRDTNFINIYRGVPSASWDSNLPEVSTYKADYRSASLPDSSCGDYLKFNGNFYVCSADQAGEFQRKITISDKTELSDPKDGIPDRMKVAVEVSWSERGRSHKVAVQELLYKWWK